MGNARRTLTPIQTSARRAALGILAVALVFCGVKIKGGQGATHQATADATGPETGAPAPHVLFQAARQLPSAYEGLATTAQILGSGQARPLTLATDDFNRDGWPDLVAGYATGLGDGVVVLYLGDKEAFAPENPEVLAGIAQGHFPTPFLPNARTFDVLEPPDFLAVGDFNKDGDPDLLVGARGSDRLYILSGDGHGNFSAPQRVPLPGKLTALAAGHIGLSSAGQDVAVGIEGINGPELLVYKDRWGGLFGQPRVYSLDAEATSLVTGSLDDDPYGDVAILGGGSLHILHGQNWGPAAVNGLPISPAAEMESVPLPSEAKAIALGDFIWDRNDRTEIAVLSYGAAVSLLSRGTPDTRPVTAAEMQAARLAMAQRRLALERAGAAEMPAPPAWRPGLTEPWQVAQSLKAGTASDLRAITTAIPGRAPQSVLLLDSAAAQVHLLTEPVSVLGKSPAYTDAGSWSEVTVASSGAPVAALPMHLSVSWRTGLVTLNKGQVAPSVMMGRPDPTYTVNRTDDPSPSSITNPCSGGTNDCSLRLAVIQADANAGSTVSIPAGTYTLTIGEGDDPTADPTEGDLDINASMTIVGAGAASTIIKASFPIVDGQDGKIFGVNQLGADDNLQLSVTGVTLENARNSVENLDPDFAYTGGAIDFFLTGTSASYTLTSCVITGNTNVHGYGAGINVDSGADSNGNFGGQFHGTVTITGCTISNNQTLATASVSPGSGADATGGGLNLFADIHNVTITNCTISGNQTSTGSSPVAAFEGGGLYIRHTNGGTVAIHSSTISGNQSASRGGGISIDGQANQTFTLDQESIIQNNVSGTLSSGTAEGGGIYIATAGGSTTLANVTVTGNSFSSNTTDDRGGGGIAVGSVAQPVTVSFSRIVGNSATSTSGGAGTGLHKDMSTGTVTATDNWWGCNTGPSAVPCDTAVIGGGGTGTPVLNFNPWLFLTLSASATTVASGGTSSLTADFFLDSAGNTISPSNLQALEGVAVTWNAVDGSISGADSTIGQTSGGEAFATFTATTSGHGNATAQVDSQTSQVNINVTVPIIVQTSPSGLNFNVDGINYTSAQTFNWVGGDPHTLATASPQSGGAGTRFVWTSWSDGGAISHGVTAPTTSTTYTANFQTQYLLTTAVSPSGAGTASPSTPAFVVSGVGASISATPASGYAFNHWSVTSGSATFGNATQASTTATLSTGPATATANFTELTTELSGLITGKSGSANARAWTITLSSSGPGAANAAQINSLTLKQTFGAACTPSIASSFPVVVGNIAPASSATGVITINFTGCPNNARFTATFTFSANGGVVTGSRTLYNQFQ